MKAFLFFWFCLVGACYYTCKHNDAHYDEVNGIVRIKTEPGGIHQFNGDGQHVGTAAAAPVPELLPKDTAKVNYIGPPGLINEWEAHPGSDIPGRKK